MKLKLNPTITATYTGSVITYRIDWYISVTIATVFIAILGLFLMTRHKLSELYQNDLEN